MYHFVTFGDGSSIARPALRAAALREAAVKNALIARVRVWPDKIFYGKELSRRRASSTRESISCPTMELEKFMPKWMGCAESLRVG